MPERRLGGLYLVTSPVRPVSRLVSIVEAAIEGGVSIVQFREKHLKRGQPVGSRITAAKAVLEVCHDHGIAFIVNDHVVLARDLGADGVHLGRDDTPPRIARRVLGPRAIVGVTVYGGEGEETAARQADADYVAAGPFFPSPTKPEEPVMPLSTLDEVVRRSALPVFAIGGITAENAGELAAHGVAGVAVVSAIMDAPDPRRASADILAAFRAGAPRGAKARG